MNNKDRLKVVLAFLLFASFFTMSLIQTSATILVFVVLLSACSSWWAYSSWQHYQIAKQSVNWPTVPFDVVHSSVVPMSPGPFYMGANRHGLSFELKYEWQGIEYRCDDLSLIGGPVTVFQSEERAKEVEASLAEMSGLHVSPGQPSLAVMTPNPSNFNLISLVLSLILSGASTMFLLFKLFWVL